MPAQRICFRYSAPNVTCSWRGAPGTHPSIASGRAWCGSLAQWKVAESIDATRGVRYYCQAHKPLPKLLTFSIEEAEAFIAGADDVCISIRHPGCEPARLSSNFREVLRLYFDDIPWVDVPAGAVQISAEQASQVAAFVTHYSAAKRLVIHCHAGCSRSVSMAMAIAAAHGQQYCPSWMRGNYRVVNKRVYDAVIAAFRREWGPR